jgi:hypothetical protein
MGLLNKETKAPIQREELTPEIAQAIYAKLIGGEKPNLVFFDGFTHYHVDEVLNEIKRLEKEFIKYAYDNFVITKGYSTINEKTNEEVVVEPVYFIADAKDNLLKKITSDYLNTSVFIDDYLNSLGFEDYNSFRESLNN